MVKSLGQCSQDGLMAKGFGSVSIPWWSRCSGGGSAGSTSQPPDAKNSEPCISHTPFAVHAQTA